MMPRQCCSAIVLMVSLLPGAQAADAFVSGSSPLVMHQHTSSAVKEMATLITDKAGLGYPGYVHLDWSDDAWTRTAIQLRQSLLNNGFSSKQILLWHDVAQKKMLSADHGLRITLLNVKSTRQPCPAVAMDYRYRKSDDMTCAVEQMRNASLLHDPADIF